MKFARQGPQSIELIKPAATSALQGPQKTVPATKLALQGPQSTVLATKSALQGHNVLRLLRNLHFNATKCCTCHKMCTSRPKGLHLP